MISKGAKILKNEKLSEPQDNSFSLAVKTESMEIIKAISKLIGDQDL